MIPIGFQVESLSDAFLAEAMPLLIAHWREIAHYQDIPLEPDIKTYRAIEASGALRVFTARAVPTTPRCVLDIRPMDEYRRSWRLVGYALFFVRPNAHYQSSVQAVQDILYVDPSVRGRTGPKFIAWCDEQLRAEGVQAVYHHVKAKHDFGKLLERQGYELVDYIFAKRLDGAPVEGVRD